MRNRDPTSGLTRLASPIAASVSTVASTTCSAASSENVPGKDGQPGKEALQVVRQQVVAPLDGRTERLSDAPARLVLRRSAAAGDDRAARATRPRQVSGAAPRRARARAAGRRGGGRSRLRIRPERSRVARTGPVGRGARPRLLRDSGSTAYSHSPCTRSGARLVASTLADPPAARRAATSLAAPRRCSKLSSNRSAARSGQFLELTNACYPCHRRTDELRVDSGASGTKNTPPGNRSRSSAPTWSRKSRLAAAAGTGERDEPFPVARAVQSAPRAPISRPTSGLDATGRFVVLRLLSGGKSPSPSW